MSMFRGILSRRKSKRTSKQEKANISVKFKEVIDNLAWMVDADMINDAQYKKRLAAQIDDMQSNGTSFKEICGNLKWLKQSEKINEQMYEKHIQIAYQNMSNPTTQSSSSTSTGTSTMIASPTGTSTMIASSTATSTMIATSKALSTKTSHTLDFDSSDSESDEEEKKLHQWQFRNEHNKWIDYGFSVNNDCNNAYANGESGIDYIFGGNLYRVDFDKARGNHIQKNISTYKQRKVRRQVIDLGKFDDSSKVTKVKLVKWQWKNEHNKWNDYSTEINNKVNQARKNGSPFVDFDANNFTYRVTFSNNTQQNLTSKMSRPIKQVTTEEEDPNADVAPPPASLELQQKLYNDPIVDEEGDHAYSASKFVIPKKPSENVEKKSDCNLTYTIINYNSTQGSIQQIQDVLCLTEHTLMDVRSAVGRDLGIDLQDTKQQMDLFWPDGYLVKENDLDRSRSLQGYSFSENQFLYILIRPRRKDRIAFRGWQSNFALQPDTCRLRLSISQSNKGMSHLLSCLYVTARHLDPSDRQKFLGHIYEITHCRPLIISLFHLIKQESLSATYRHVICEGLFVLFRCLIPEHIAKDHEIFEHSDKCLLFLSKYAMDDHEDLFPTPTSRILNCPLTGELLDDPVTVPISGTSTAFSRATILAKIKKGEIPAELNYSLALKESDLKKDEFLARMISGGVKGRTAYKWNIGKNDDIFKPCTWTNKISFDVIQRIASSGENALYQIIPSLQLKSVGLNLPVLTLEKNGYTCVFYGRGKSSVTPAQLYQPHAGATKEESPDTLATHTQPFFNVLPMKVVNTIKNRKPEEAIMVLLDISMSMCNHFANDMTRLTYVKQLFHSLANRSMAYNYPNYIGLVRFGQRAHLVCPLTPNFENFKAHVDAAECNGQTALYDAIRLGIRELKKFKVENPDCNLRIFCLTDGEDTTSKKTPKSVLLSLMKYKIVVDAVVIGDVCDTALQAMSNATCGLCMNPGAMGGNALQEGFKLFEHETVLSVKERPKSIVSIPRIETEEDYERLLKTARRTQFAIPPSRPLPENLNGRYVRPETAIAEAQKSKTNNGDSKDQAEPKFEFSKILPLGTDVPMPTSKKHIPRGPANIKRIMQELRSIASKRGAHPSIHVFPSDDLYLWQVLMEGPDNTPYMGGIFSIYVNFPPEYPDVPPEVRFLTNIYHCNINNSGRICHSVFDRDYVSTLKVSFILQCVFGLLLFPAPEDPLDSVKASEFLSTPQVYRTNAHACTKKYAKKFTLRQLKQQMLGDDFVETEKRTIFVGGDFTTVEVAKKQKTVIFSSASSGGTATSTTTIIAGSADSASAPSALDDDDEDEPPPNLVCPITFGLFKDPVVNKHGSTYEREAIVAHLKKHNTDPLTGQALTSEDGLFVNRQIKQMCTDWLKKHPDYDGDN